MYHSTSMMSSLEPISLSWGYGLRYIVRSRCTSLTPWTLLFVRILNKNKGLRMQPLQNLPTKTTRGNIRIIEDIYITRDIRMTGKREMERNNKLEI